MGFGVALACTLNACSVESPPGPEERLGQSESWIINGQLDFEHDAVVAVFGQQSGCTGTIIHRNASNVYVLTAAHCFGPGPLQQVVVADDYNQSISAIYNVVDYQLHPQYNANQNTFDFAMMRASGGTDSTPVIGVLSPALDQLAGGTAVDHVGYGLVSYPNGQTSARHHAAGTLSQVATYQISYNQPVAGPCSGDSGGPNLVDTPEGERVAGVISFGDQECNQFGVSGRASAVYDSFIVPFVGEEPSTSSTGGMGGVGGAGGAGVPVGGSSSTGQGAGPSDGNWGAPGADEKDYDGVLIESGCSMHPAGRGSGLAWLGALVLAAAALRRRQFFTRRIGSTGRLDGTAEVHALDAADGRVCLDVALGRGRGG